MPAESDVIRLAIVDDHDVMREGLASLLEQAPGIAISWSGTGVENLGTSAGEIDVVLLDVRFEDAKVDPVHVSRLVAQGKQVVLLTAFPNDPHVAELIKRGAAGVVAKRQNCDELISAIRQTVSYGSLTNTDTLSALASTSADAIGLTDQERNVLLLYGSGMKIDAVAHQLNISPHTVKDYLRRLRRKLLDAGMAAPSQVSLYQRAQELGLID